MDEASIWEDYNEDRWGRLDELVDDPDYAEGFMWTCCNELTTVGACKESWHELQESNRARHT